MAREGWFGGGEIFFGGVGSFVWFVWLEMAVPGYLFLQEYEKLYQYVPKLNFDVLVQSYLVYSYMGQCSRMC